MEQSYKEKYEQAIERLKQWDREHPCAGYVLSDRDKFIFPELAESEDEKVRKEIEQLIRCMNVCDTRRERWLSWLEKQAEQKPQRMISAEAKEAIYDKPADTVEPKFKVGDKIYLKPEYRMPNDDTPIANTVKEIRRIDDKHYRFDGSYIFIEDQDKYELVEQKPKENKGNIGGISSNWSEEDEEMLDSIIGDIYNADTLIGGKETASNKCSWLKSLKGRVKPYWKPSETDITILEKVFNEKINPKDFQVTLLNVLEQLKKLKEGKV